MDTVFAAIYLYVNSITQEVMAGFS